MAVGWLNVVGFSGASAEVGTNNEAGKAVNKEA